MKIVVNLRRPAFRSKRNIRLKKPLACLKINWKILLNSFIMQKSLYRLSRIIKPIYKLFSIHFFLRLERAFIKALYSFLLFLFSNTCFFKQLNEFILTSFLAFCQFFRITVNFRCKSALSCLFSQFLLS